MPFLRTTRISSMVSQVSASRLSLSLKLYIRISQLAHHLTLSVSKPNFPQSSKGVSLRNTCRLLPTASSPSLRILNLPLLCPHIQSATCSIDSFSDMFFPHSLSSLFLELQVDLWYNHLNLAPLSFNLTSIFSIYLTVWAALSVIFLKLCLPAHSFSSALSNFLLTLHLMFSL